MFKSQEEIDSINRALNSNRNDEKICEIQSNQLILMEAMATQYEESLENRLNDQEVQATIYETLLEMQGGN